MDMTKIDESKDIREVMISLIFQKKTIDGPTIFKLLTKAYAQRSDTYMQDTLVPLLVATCVSEINHADKYVLHFISLSSNTLITYISLHCYLL